MSRASSNIGDRSESLKSFRTARGHRWINRFAKSQSGSIGILFCAMLVPTVAVLGMAIDYGRASHRRTILQTSLDSAVLAAGRAYQVSGDPSNAEIAAAEYFGVGMKGIEGVEILKNTADVDNSSMTFSAKVSVETTFVRILGYDAIEVSSSAESMLAKGGIDKNLEISLMLDITGSMCSPCSKLNDMKDAAKDLVNILVQSDQSEYTSRVALVPFSHAVNVGSTYFEQVTGEAQVVEDEYDFPPSCYKKGKLKKSCEGNPDYLVVEGHSYSSCVVERAGSNKFTDDQPGSGNQTYLGIYDIERANSNTVDEDTACKPESRIVPLSDDKDGLNDAIDAFQASGWTAGQIGTAWAWYLLSPEWNSFWPPENQAGSYSADETMKIAVLMTDGDYNTAYQTGNGSSAAQAKQLCTKMKNEGITVYTVGFMVSSSAQDLLEKCASSPSNFYNATNGEQLKIAFRNIAFTVAQLRLSK